MRLIKKINDKCILLYCLILSLFMQSEVFGASLTNNSITNGIKKLTDDFIKVAMLLSSGLAISMIVFYLIKKKLSKDEMESKQYTKKAIAVIICYICIMSAGLILQIVSGYFGISASV